MARRAPLKAAPAKKARKTAASAPSSAAMEPIPLETAPASVKRRGRPPKSTTVAAVDPATPGPLGDELVVRQVSLSDIDLGDTTYRFRAVVRVSDLVKSIRESGQQIPAVVRPHPNQEKGYKWQLVSGFRRATALSELNATHIAAYVRRDLTDDQDAFRASVLENMARKTYSDIDRAYVIKRDAQRTRPLALAGDVVTSTTARSRSMP